MTGPRQAPGTRTDTTCAPGTAGLGRLHLIPVGLGDAPVARWLPPEAQAAAAGLSIYIAENAKAARAFLKQIGTERPLQEITVHAQDADTPVADIRQWLAPLRQGRDIGLVSDAGCPAVADPGARVVAAAHAMGAEIQPWVGPSSILLGLMASGLDGQRFAFHGYAPVQEGERARQIKAWEQHSMRHKQTQLFIETPYRNRAMFDTLLQTLRGDTRLCVARALTTEQQWVRTRTIAEWKQHPAPALDKQPTLFLFLG
ncbi:SAM-dependent methyltransferase [Verticiella sediminum]|uniref:SAM-dependent methyltransferase n=1 Tax=Verticiella sediminum TaxID=1247510 RepID=A0A556AS31_9BURK|nr:SAM-dependent methyltransferase [Verticiella sediminum]TSH95752.1 SAM-dependent methyltransferase [Verticiella sediminum]